MAKKKFEFSEEQIKYGLTHKIVTNLDEII